MCIYLLYTEAPTQALESTYNYAIHMDPPTHVLVQISEIP